MTGFWGILIWTWMCPPSLAFWMWTPETNRWVNPKYVVKETPKAQFEYAREFYRTKEYPKAIAEFKKLIQHYPRAREAAEAQYYIGLSLEKEEKPYEAFKAYQQVIEKYPFSERSPQVIEKQFRIGERLLKGDQKKSKFVEAVTGGDYSLVEVFRAVIKNAPYGPYAASAQYKIGLYLKAKELYQEARDEFEKVVNDYPESEWAKAAQYQLALVDAERSSSAQYDQKTTQAAVDGFKDFVKTYPNAQLSKEAQDHIQNLRTKEAHNAFLIAHFYEKQKNYKAAKIYYAAIIDDYQNTVWAAKSLEKIRELERKTQ